MGTFPILLVGCSFCLPLCSHSTSSSVSFIKLSPGFLLSSLGSLLYLPFNFYLAVKCWEFLKPDSRSPLFLNLYFPCLWFQWSLIPTWLIYIFNPFALWRFWTVYATALSISPIEIPLYIQHIQNWRHGLLLLPAHYAMFSSCGPCKYEYQPSSNYLSSPLLFIATSILSLRPLNFTFQLSVESILLSLSLPVPTYLSCPPSTLLFILQ